MQMRTIIICYMQASRVTRVMLADGTVCEIAGMDTVLHRICDALETVPARHRDEMGRALLEMAVAYIGPDACAPRSFPSRDSGPRSR